MTKGEALQTIYAQFDQSAKQFCKETNGLFCEISSVYKGEEVPQNLRFRYAKVYYNALMVRFTYTAHGILNTVNSILSCELCFDKTRETYAIPLPLATDYCDLDIIQPMCIPFITNDAAMCEAFACIADVLRQTLDRFQTISHDKLQRNRLSLAFVSEVMEVFGVDEVSEFLQHSAEFVGSFFAQRFCTDAFLNALKQDWPRAVKQLKKVKKTTGYERRMLRLWSAGPQQATHNLRLIRANADNYNAAGVAKTDWKEFGAMFLSWLVLTPAISAVYLAIYFLLVFFQGRNSVYLMGPMYNFPNCILFGFITGIGLSYFARFRIYKLLRKKDYEKYCEMDHIQTSPGEIKFMKGFVALLIVGSIIGSVLVANCNLNFYSNGFMDNSTLLSLRGTYYSYGDVEKVYYKANRVNSFGDTLENPSYVLVLKSGTEIDLIDHGDLEDYEDILIPLFREQGIPIVYPDA